MKLNKRTKIIATVGPACENPEVMTELIKSGVNVFRFNMKHGDVEWHKKFIIQAREISQKIGINIGILIDLQGPEIRIKTFNAKVLEIKKGDLIKFTNKIENLNDNEKVIYSSQTNIVNSLEVGDRIVIDDGALFFTVREKESDYISMESHSENPLKNNKSLNVIDKDVDLPSLTEEDKVRLTLAEQVKVDFIALSFVREVNDLKFLKDEMKKRNIEAKIISKIENKKGIQNIDSIIDESYGIMVARGDLGIETPIEGVTFIQKELIKRCRAKSKPVIVATQMLESMINSKFPTRAEAADVANAVFDYTDCVMLSGETAYGANPIDVVQIMSKICSYNETVIPESTFEYKVALLNMSYGVYSYKTKYSISDLSSYDKIMEELVAQNILEKGETVIAIHGQKFGLAGGTNSLMIVQV